MKLIVNLFRYYFLKLEECDYDDEWIWFTVVVATSILLILATLVCLVNFPILTLIGLAYLTYRDRG